VSSRFLAGVWALFAVVFTASYTANLAAFMITKEDYDRISGIKDPLVIYVNKSVELFWKSNHRSASAYQRCVSCERKKCNGGHQSLIK